MDSEGPVTRWWMPGEPTTDSFWSERNTDGSGSMMGPSDRKLTLSFRGFDLHPGEWARFTFAIVWAQGADHLDSVAQLKALTASLHASRPACWLLARQSLRDSSTATHLSLPNSLLGRRTVPQSSQRPRQPAHEPEMERSGYDGSGRCARPNAESRVIRGHPRTCDQTDSDRWVSARDVYGPRLAAWRARRLAPYRLVTFADQSSTDGPFIRKTAL